MEKPNDSPWDLAPKVFRLLSLLLDNWRRVNEEGSWDCLDEGVESFVEKRAEGITCSGDGMTTRLYVQEGWDHCDIELPDGYKLWSDGCSTGEVAVQELMWIVLEHIRWRDRREDGNG